MLEGTKVSSRSHRVTMCYLRMMMRRSGAYWIVRVLQHSIDRHEQPELLIQPDICDLGSGQAMVVS